MSDELVYEAFNERRYAPSLREFNNTLFDPQLEIDIKKIPDKLAFKIGEVADIVGVKTYVLRYWETELSSFIRTSQPKISVFILSAMSRW